MIEILLQRPKPQQLIYDSINYKIICRDNEISFGYLHNFITLDIIQHYLKIFLENNDIYTEMWEFIDEFQKEKNSCIRLVL